jgi:hypothetical protein
MIRLKGQTAQNYGLSHFCDQCKALYDTNGNLLDAAQVYAIRTAAQLGSYYGVHVVVVEPENIVTKVSAA